MQDLPDYQADAERVFDVVCADGIAIVPGDLGFAIIGSSKAAMDAIHRVKRRPPTKLHGFTGDAAIEREVHITDDRARAFIEVVTEAFDLPLGVVAPFRPDHPLIRAIDPDLLPLATSDGTLNIVRNGGPFLDALAALCDRHCVPIFGSSANVSTRGVKARLIDVEAEIVAAADIVIDYGVCRWYEGGRSSTMIDMRDFSVIRFGVSYGQIADIARRFFGVHLPDDQTIRWSGGAAAPETPPAAE